MGQGINLSIEKLYFLDFHIEKQAPPLIGSGIRPKISKASIATFDSELGYFILLVEGFQKHVHNLEVADATRVLEETKKVNRQFLQFKNSDAAQGSLNNEALQTKIKYAIKALNRLEAMLHVAATKGLPRLKTSENIKNGLAKYSQEAIAQSLSRK